MNINDPFERRQDISTYWWNKSNDLYAAAAAVWDSMTLTSSKRLAKRYALEQGFDMRAAVPSVFRMLCGMSLELLYKALLVRAGAKVPHTHDLAKLARLAGLTVTPEDQGLLDILTEAVIWDGRYPIPKDRSTWDALSALEMTHLYTKEHSPGSRFATFTPNRALSWQGYSAIREKAMAAYTHPGI